MSELGVPGDLYCFQGCIIALVKIMLGNSLLPVIGRIMTLQKCSGPIKRTSEYVHLHRKELRLQVELTLLIC